MGLVFPCHVLSSTKILVTSETLTWLFLSITLKSTNVLASWLAYTCVLCCPPSQAPARKPTNTSPWVLPVAQQLGSAGKHILPAGRNTGKH